MNPQNQSSLDQEPLRSQVVEMIEEGETNASISRELGCSKDAVRRFRKRHALGVPARPTKAGKKPGVEYLADGSANVTGSPVVVNHAGRSGPVRSIDMSDPDAILREHGFDPDKWIMEGAKLNRWDGPAGGGNVVTYHQVTLRIRPRKPQVIVPVRSDGWIAPQRLNIKINNRPRKVVIFGDQQAPFYDERLLQAAQEWLYDNKPDEQVYLGDTVDLPDISRHRNNPDLDPVIMECLQSGYNWLRATVEAAPDSKRRKLPGNHDERIRNYIIEKVPQLHGLRQVTRPGEMEGPEVHSLVHLMRLDELGIEFVDPKASYEQGEIKLSKYLAVAHGWIARQGGGASALASLEQTGYSIIVGHTHRQSIVHKTTHDIDGNTTVLKGVEAGCMCLIDQAGERNIRGLRFPTFTNKPDWQQGFVSATIWPDGTFNIDPATYVNGKLIYRDKQYS